MRARPRRPGRQRGGAGRARRGRGLQRPGAVRRRRRRRRSSPKCWARTSPSSRRPVTEPGRPAPFPTSELEGRQGARILPEWIDVVDDPTQTEWRGRPLFGHYEVDREGVAAEPLPLVEKGVLKNFLLTRQPVRGFEGSNGRARLPGSFGASAAAISNLFVRAARDGAARRAEEEAASRSATPAASPTASSSARWISPPRRPRGGAPAAGRLAVGRRAPGEHAPAGLQGLPDGREELVRGLRFRGLNARSLQGHPGGRRRRAPSSSSSTTTRRSR